MWVIVHFVVITVHNTSNLSMKCTFCKLKSLFFSMCSLFYKEGNVQIFYSYYNRETLTFFYLKYYPTVNKIKLFVSKKLSPTYLVTLRLYVLVLYCIITKLLNLIALMLWLDYLKEIDILKLMPTLKYKY